MPSALSVEDKHKLISLLTRRVIDRLLQFKLTHDLTVHQIEKLRTNWRDVEIELHDDYPVKEAGVIAVLGGDGIEGFDHDDFFITDEPIAPEDTVSLLGSFPLNDASCAYVFTLMEQFGDDIVETVNPTFVKKRVSWHREVFGAAQFKSNAHKEKMCDAFAAPFDIGQYQISSSVVLSLMKMKKERNSFAHEGTMNMRFNEFFRSAIQVIAYIYLMLMPEPQILVVHNSDDLSGRFLEAEELFRELHKSS